jgi:hypothetical protein
MKIDAYFLAATPQWTKASVSVYYPYVKNLYVSYDQNNIGWNGKPLQVEETLKLLRELDVDSKIILCPGSYYDSDKLVWQNEAQQRGEILSIAGENGADWVLQVDADEVMTSPETFFHCLNKAEEKGFRAMHYPARFLYQYLGGSLFLEECRRFWQVSAGFPGPLAIKPACTLSVARQCTEPSYRVDFAPHNTDHFHPRDTRVDHVIKQNEGITHYAWIRSESALQLKFSNHADICGKQEYLEYKLWSWAAKHPLWAMLRTPIVRRRTLKRFLRIVSMPVPNEYAAQQLELLIQDREKLKLKAS